MKILRQLLLLISVVVITACGGGSGGDEPPAKSNDPPQSSDSGDEQPADNNGSNIAPVAQSQSFTVAEDNFKQVILTSTDVDTVLDDLTYTILTQPTNGLLSFTAPNLRYSPNADFYGNDSFTFKVSDGELDSNVATISIAVSPINDAPTASDFVGEFDWGQVIILLDGDDIEGQSLDFTVLTQPSNGTLTGIAPELIYTPNLSYVGTDSFTYISNDGELDSQIATVAITINANTALTAKPLNDTGVIGAGSSLESNSSDCTGDYAAQQDCSYGRDVTHNDDSDGFAGFSYTKLDANGGDLSASATEWSCVKDNVTGLIWEVKTDNGSHEHPGLHDADDTYTWYNTDQNTNGGLSGEQGGPRSFTCYGLFGSNGNPSDYCNTQAFVARVNNVGLCGANNWRMPSTAELESIISYGIPTIDRNYFPNIRWGNYWSSQPTSSNRFFAWRGNFSTSASESFEGDGAGRRSTPNFVRLVRDGQ